MKKLRRQKFERLVNASCRGDDECWPWAGVMDAKGYGRYSGLMAHRAVYRELVGAIPEGMEVDHLCRNRACVNPRHLEAVDHHTNTLRSENFIGRHARKTHCDNGHALTGDNVRSVAQSGRGTRRQCVTCYRASQQRYKRRIRAERVPTPRPIRTHCAKGHEMTPENTRVRVKDGRSYRACRECQRATKRGAWDEDVEFFRRVLHPMTARVSAKVLQRLVTRPASSSPTASAP